MVICSLFVALSDFLFKSGAKQFESTMPWQIVRNPFVLLGASLTVCSFALNVTAYRFGDIAVLSPLLQLTLVWSMLGAIFLFKEKVNLKIILGASLILSGAVFLSLSPG